MHFDFFFRGFNFSNFLITLTRTKERERENVRDCHQMLFQILGPFQQVIFTQAPFSHIQCIQCDQIWQYFSTLAKLKSIYGFVLYLAKF